MNILEIIKSYKSKGESITLDTTVSGIRSSEYVDFIEHKGEEFIRFKVSKSYIYYNKDGHLVLNNDSFLTESEVIVSNECMLSVYSVDPTVPESSSYISCHGKLYYVFDGLKVLDSCGDLWDLDPFKFDKYEVIQEGIGIKEFIDSLTNLTGIHTIFNGILREGYSIISYSPYLKSNSFSMLIDLISKDDEIDINNVVNYAIEIPITAITSYVFDIKDLKTYDELHN